MWLSVCGDGGEVDLIMVLMVRVIWQTRGHHKKSLQMASTVSMIRLWKHQLHTGC